MTDRDPPDPFSSFESDRTIIKPSAGRKPAAGQAPAAAPSSPAAWASAPAPMADAGLGLDALNAAHVNPLVAAASTLLCTAPRIRTMASHPNPASLKEALAEGLRQFEQQARNAGVANEQVIAGRYVHLPR
jgi:type VI secretion system protein ImpK